ncbi:uncharacterized metal-binding protein [Geminocystis sp. NIES-3708]|uniref:metal-binding protein n=1 Tax=Geminocystis sp. NIES-3708 TaxID=1615909 RepID=UPI0005FC72AC|nr:metal-binding protein [Geminocystis sp. NIES-3708]BAQ60309.1 uncharacterized metal-binding protein [Geminocystis sp. NIES-3708]
MSSGKNHDRITWICLPLILTIFLVFTKRFDFSFLASLGFLFSGLMFGPDLDIYSIQYQRWGFLKFIWLPYQKTLKHRSFFSHGFIIGTIIRICYLSFILLIFFFLFLAIANLFVFGEWHWQKYMINTYSIVKNKYWQELLFLFIGLELGAMSHYVADYISSLLKKRKKKFDKSKSFISRPQKTVNKNLKKTNNKRRSKN